MIVGQGDYDLQTSTFPFPPGCPPSPPLPPTSRKCSAFLEKKLMKSDFTFSLAKEKVEERKEQMKG
jgi:hypothetical protein